MADVDPPKSQSPSDLKKCLAELCEKVKDLERRCLLEERPTSPDWRAH